MRYHPTTAGTHKPGRARSSSSDSSSSSVSPPASRREAGLDLEVTETAEREVPIPVEMSSDAAQAATPAIGVESLDAYFGSSRVVRDVTFAVPTGEVTAIIGPSGCGKSTLLRCLNRMHETVPGARAEGEVRFQGTDIYGPGVSAIGVRRHIGMVFQRPTPFPTMSIRDNVAAGLKVLRR